MADIFVSYAREDKDFVTRLNKAMKARGRETWLDLKDILPAEEWRKKIKAGINGARAFVFVLSPDWLASQECRQEMEHAVASHKRLIPVVCREVEAKAVPVALGSLNWILMREQEDFERQADKLLTAVDTDLEWVDAHTSLLEKATEWERKYRNRSLLLRGEELREAEGWQVKSAEKEPKPTELMASFIVSSRQDETRRQRYLLGGVTAGFIVAISLAILAFYQFQVSEVRRRVAQSRQLTVQSRSLIESKPDLALLLSLEANRVSEEIVNPGSFLQGLVTKAVLAISKENYEIGEPQQVLFAALTLPPHRVRFFHQTSSVMVFSPDGRKFVFIADKELVVHDLDSGQEVRQPLTGFDEFGHIYDMALSSDGRVLALKMRKSDNDVDSAAYVAFCEVNKCQPLGPILDLKHTEVAFSPNGKLLASKTDEDEHIEVRDLCNLKLLYRLEIPGKSLKLDGLDNLIFSKDGQTLLSWYIEGDVIRCIRWDITSHQPILLPIKEQFFKPEMALGPKGKSLAVLKREMGQPAIVLYSMPVWKQIAQFSMREVSQYEFVLSPDETVLAVIENEHHGTAVDPPIQEKDFLIAYDVRQRKEVGRFLVDNDIYLHNLVFSPDGKILAGNDSSGVYLWDVPHLRPLRPVLRHPGIERFIFCPDDEHIASSDREGNIILWKLSCDPLGRVFDSREQRVDSFAFSPCSQKLLVAKEGRTLEIWKLADLPSVSARLRFRKDEDSRQIYKLEEPKWIKTQDFEEGFNALAFSSNGEVLAVADFNDMYLIDVKHGIQLGKTIHNPDDSSWEIVFAFNSEGDALAASTEIVHSQTMDENEERTITLWNLSRGQILRKLAGHKGMVTCMDFSPGGRLLASGDYTGDLFLWDVSTGTKEQLTLNLDKKSPSLARLAFSLDGGMLAYAADEDIILWNVVKKPKECAALERGKTLAGKDFDVPLQLDLSFSPDGKTLAAASLDGVVFLWDVGTGIPIGSIPHRTYRPEKTPEIKRNRVAFSPDGKTLAFFNQEEIILHDADLKSWKNRARSIANRDLNARERQQYLNEKP